MLSLRAANARIRSASRCPAFREHDQGVLTLTEGFSDEREVKEGYIHHIEFVKAGEDPAKVYEPAEEPFDLIASSVHEPVVFPRRDAIALGRTGMNPRSLANWRVLSPS